MFRVSLYILAVGLAIVPSLAITIHIPADYPTIQAGINAAVNGDTVLVAPGTYNEAINFSGREIVLKSAQGPDSTTIITHNGHQNVVTFNSGEGRAAVLAGFTLTNDYLWDQGGSGVFCLSGSAPTIRENIITSCGGQWGSFGGGIHVDQSNPLIEYNVISNNGAAYYGGGIYLRGADSTVIHKNLIISNISYPGYGYAYGGGICLYGGRATIEGNIIINNSATVQWGYGGGIDVLGPITINLSDFNDVWNNIPCNYHGCTPGPGSISLDPQFTGGANPYELAANSPCIDAGPFTSLPDPDGTRSDMGAYYHDQEGVNVALKTAIWPITIPASGGSFSCQIYLTNHTSSSRTFDAWIYVGQDSLAMFPPIVRQGLTFAAGQQVIRQLTQSIPSSLPPGNYFYRACTGNYNSGEIFCEVNMPFTKQVGGRGPMEVGDWSLTGWESEGVIQAGTENLHPSSFVLHACSPNPFNPFTAIRYQLSANSHVSLRVYDTAGRLVTTLVDGWSEAGVHEVTFDGSNLASGLYFVRMQAGDFTGVQKMMLVK